MSSFLSVPAAVATVVLVVTPAAACQSGNDTMPNAHTAPDTQAAIGLWDIRPADSGASGLCRLALRGEVLGDGQRLVLANCDLKAVRGAHHWRGTAGGFVLVDAAGVPLMTFTADTVDSWIGSDPDGRQYRMERTAMF